METVLNQISIGGCLAAWDAEVYVGDEFRLLVELPNKNFLPLQCKVLHCSEDATIGAKFLDITQFEQELLTKIISQSLEEHGLPLQISPFVQPKTFVKSEEPRLTNKRREKEEIIENILSLND